jgi:aromatic-L-amino-acid/L-tryptophan decarboxylase
MSGTDRPSSELIAHGREILDWIAQYLDHPEAHPVVARAKPGEIRAQLPVSAPVDGEPLATILADVQRIIVPGVTHWNHPGFFAYFPTSASIPGILGELLTAGLNINAMLWKTSPAATELEQLALDWLRQMLGLNAGWDGHINDTASISSLLALAAARESRTELAIRERGMAGRSDLPRLRIYCSAHAHSSIDKAALALGMGLENVVHVGVDDTFAMRPDLLERAIVDDRAQGFLPLACVATVGTTSTTSIDPVPRIADLCEREQLWLHVDGAYGGIAALVPELRYVLDGADRADSIVVNPHKWMFTPVDCSVLYLKRPEILRRAFSLLPEYLVTREQHEVVNLMDYGIQLGRRFRALKLWMVMRAFGSNGLAERLRAHCELARELSSWIDVHPEWELMAPVPFSLVCFRYARAGLTAEEQDARTEAILHRVNETGEAYLSHTKLHGRTTLRLAIGNIRTERRHVERAWELLKEAAHVMG